MKSNHKGFENRNTFPKNYRLINKSDFNMSDSRFLVEFPLKVVFKTRDNCVSNSRLGLVVSKKFSKSAVSRNYVKRVLRESFRTSKLVHEGLDLIAILSKPVHGVEKERLGNFITEKFKKIEGRVLWAQSKKER